jgi:excisionase family DNA binding protein
MDKDFYSVKEFSEKLCVSTHTIRRAIKNGRISALRAGSTKNSTLRIPHSEISRMGIVDMEEMIKKLIKEHQNDVVL